MFILSNLERSQTAKERKFVSRKCLLSKIFDNKRHLMSLSTGNKHSDITRSFIYFKFKLNSTFFYCEIFEQEIMNSVIEQAEQMETILIIHFHFWQTGKPRNYLMLSSDLFLCSLMVLLLISYFCHSFHSIIQLSAVSLQISSIISPTRSGSHGQHHPLLSLSFIPIISSSPSRLTPPPLLSPSHTHRMIAGRQHSLISFQYFNLGSE